LVKPQLRYASEAWSPASSVLTSKVERIQNRANKWILCVKNGEISCKERLQQLYMLHLVYYREVEGLVFLFKAVNGYSMYTLTSIARKFVYFVNSDRTRRSLSIEYLETPLCKTCSYISSYFNRVVKLWNSVCNSIDPRRFLFPSPFRIYLKNKYNHTLETVFDPEMTCTWL
jgi:hypothetical protein